VAQRLAKAHMGFNNRALESEKETDCILLCQAEMGAGRSRWQQVDHYYDRQFFTFAGARRAEVEII